MFNVFRHESDQLPEGVHCASTSNQTSKDDKAKVLEHGQYPAMAAAAAIHGKFVDVEGGCLNGSNQTLYNI